MEEDRFRLHTRKKFFTVRVESLTVKPQFPLTVGTGCPGRPVDAPSLEVSKTKLDGALNNLVYWEISLPIAFGLELDDLKGPFQC